MSETLTFPDFDSLSSTRRETPVRDVSDAFLKSTLESRFKISSFRTGQLDIIRSVLSGKDVLAVLPTGGGKSLCYQLPAIVENRLVVVVSPLIALMKDQVQAMVRLGLPAGALHSGQGMDEKRQVFEEMRMGGAFLLYVSPERVQKEGFQTWIKNRDVALFAIDEAHCVSQWGHDFREEYGKLSILKTLRPEVPVLALTASATPIVLNDVSQNLKLKAPARMVHGFYRPNLYYQVETCADDDAKLSLVLQALRQTPTGRILIYCGTRRVTEELSSTLSNLFAGVDFYHAGLSTEERNRTQQCYIEGTTRILVATNAFGMGIDQPDVRLVVHFQMPANIDSLYQEMGRAGRDGLDSTCLMLYSRKDKGLQSYFIESSDAPASIKSSRWRNLEALVGYAEGGECRHSEILNYYKDSQRIESCGHCDTCLPGSARKVVPPVVEKKVAKSEGRAARKTEKRSAAKTESTAHVLDATASQRFERLRLWRKEKARELDTAAFIVFGDKTLRELAFRCPQNYDELRDIKGIGEAKLERFGAELLKVLASYD